MVALPAEVAVIVEPLYGHGCGVVRAQDLLGLLAHLLQLGHRLRIRQSEHFGKHVVTSSRSASASNLRIVGEASDADETHAAVFA